MHSGVVVQSGADAPQQSPQPQLAIEVLFMHPSALQEHTGALHSWEVTVQRTFPCTVRGIRQPLFTAAASA